LTGLARAEDFTYESTAPVVEGDDTQPFENFISNSLRDHVPVGAHRPGRGSAGCQVLGRRSRHRHVTIVPMAMLFICRKRVACPLGLDPPSPRDIVGIFKETPPRKPEGGEALVARIDERREKRKGALDPRHRTQQPRVGITKPNIYECDSINLAAGFRWSEHRNGLGPFRHCERSEDIHLAEIAG
jgi:hypothetical protein